MDRGNFDGKKSKKEQYDKNDSKRFVRRNVMRVFGHNQLYFVRKLDTLKGIGKSK